MICIKCDSEAFAEQPNTIIEQEFRGELLKVKMAASACTKCGWVTLALGQTDELRRLTADAYRQKHGLLTSAEIVSRRTRLDMNQLEFADFLRVGEASVKRWETWQVQDASSDELIRMKTDFLAQLQQSTHLALIHHFLTSYSVEPIRVKESVGFDDFVLYIQRETDEPKREFSLLNCRQTTPGGHAGRKCFADNSDPEYDTDTTIAAAA